MREFDNSTKESNKSLQKEDDTKKTIDLSLIEGTVDKSWQEELEEIEKTERLQLERIEQREKERARRRALRRKKKRRMMYTMWFGMAMVAMAVVLLIVVFFKKTVPAVSEYVEESIQNFEEEIAKEDKKPLKIWERPDLEVNFLTPNEYSRPQNHLPEVNNIFVHYTANQGTSAAQNRSYFENLGITHERSASAHFVIGFEGEIIQCLPLMEIGYAVQKHNFDSVSIECCYLDDDGKFTQATIDSLVELLAWLISKYDLTTDDILRHYDSNGKMCPKYYVEHEDEWEEIKEAVDEYIQKNGTTEPPEDEY